MENNTWSLTEIWNKELTFGKGERELYKRDYIWASELGKDHYERWLKMNAIKPDFGYDERILRKFEAGNFFERIIAFVLVVSGLLIYDNKKYEIPTDENHLKISVKPDFIAGGKPNWEEARKRVSEEMLFRLMPNLGRIANQLVEVFSKQYPDGLEVMTFEIKSINSQVFWSKKDYLQEAYPHHILQAFAEMKATGLPKGKILYISKDDLTTSEFSISADSKVLNEMYEIDVRTLSKYIREGIEPPKPENIVFDPRGKIKFQKDKETYKIEGCYVGNWQIAWSNYISRITGIKGKTQAEVATKWERSIAKELKEKNDELKEQFKTKLEKA
jgi:hypothetical protein